MLRHGPHERTVADIARATHGIVTILELRASGYTDQEVRTLVAKGYLHRLRRGVFAVGHLALGDEARRMAAVRMAGPGAHLTGVSAASCWRITRLPDDVVDVAVPRPRRPIKGVRAVVDTRIPTSAITTHRNIPVADPNWTLVSLASRFGAGTLTRFMREASYRRLLHLPTLVAVVEGGDRRPGIDNLRRAIDLRTAGSAGYASSLERDVNRYVRSLDAPSFLPNVVIEGAGSAYEVDMVWHELGVCAEIDGPIHDDPDVRREDGARSTDLTAAGWVVIRIHWTAWEADRANAVAPLIDALTVATRSTYRVSRNDFVERDRPGARWLATRST